MRKYKIAILGSTGMLGNMVLHYLARNEQFDIVAFSRDVALSRSITDAKNVRHRRFSLYKQFQNQAFDYIINCVGVVNKLITSAPFSILTAIEINSIFPATLSTLHNSKIIQIATDCVFSGKDGPYSELREHDAVCAYGKTKSLGEIRSANFFNLRCSIIGHAVNGKPYGLLDWFLNNKDGHTVEGYGNHYWNGITTLQFAKICENIIINNIKLPSLQHVVPFRNGYSKEQLLHLFNDIYHRNINIKHVIAQTSINRVLTTIAPTINEQLWAGEMKTIPLMIEDLYHYQKAYI